ncbi:MAG: 3-deoxy-D-manno-octulosonate cytidylyltransferase [Verrucomicrobia bacterium GWF2_51_19]|nr:MAG: 3-deoxy-D-manno-octulosonate cytidylyltransferase [Verrucomicrobia bacterium GWF2_51_19]HCJ11505.1 3-deoxy-manno-octulosonate cytidylyltransferase [Opitutae bacterium]
MKVSIAIPARLTSKRLPRKVLMPLNGKPVLQHIWERAQRCRHADEVIVLVDSEELQAVVRSWGARCVLTNPNCQSGTERIIEALSAFKNEFVVNIQGDEPFMRPELVDALAERHFDTRVEMLTVVFPIKDSEMLFSPNTVKVVRRNDGSALYFSRAAIPVNRDVPQPDWLQKHTYWGHIGLYGYTRMLLESFKAFPRGLDAIESLEQLRFLQNGVTIQTVETDRPTLSIDTIEDYRLAQQQIRDT